MSEARTNAVPEEHKQVPAYLPVSLLNEIDKEAGEMDVKRGWMIRHLLKTGMQKYKEGKAA